VHLLGHSRSGAVVIEVAKRHPDVIRSLILSGASCKLDLAETEENRKADASVRPLLTQSGHRCYEVSSMPAKGARGSDGRGISLCYPPASQS
jgi:pimeloyl-ACP methyl ester carboxylesterase